MYRPRSLWREDSREITPIINALSFSPSQSHLATICVDKKMRIYDVETLELVRTIHHGSGEHSLVGVYSPVEDVIACGPKKLSLFDADTGKRVETFVGNKKNVFALAFSPDGARLWSGAFSSTSGRGECLWCWDRHTGARVWSGFEREQIVSLAISSDGGILFIALSYRPPRASQIVALDTTTFEEVWRVDVEGRPHRIEYHATQNTLRVDLGGSMGIERVQFHNTSDGTPESSFTTRTMRSVALDESGDEPILLSLESETIRGPHSLRAHELGSGRSSWRSDAVEIEGVGFTLAVSDTGDVFVAGLGWVAAWSREADP